MRKNPEVTLSCMMSRRRGTRCGPIRSGSFPGNLLLSAGAKRLISCRFEHTLQQVWAPLQRSVREINLHAFTVCLTSQETAKRCLFNPASPLSRYMSLVVARFMYTNWVLGVFTEQRSVSSETETLQAQSEVGQFVQFLHRTSLWDNMFDLSEIWDVKEFRK